MKVIRLIQRESPGRPEQVMLEGRLAESTMLHELVYAVREGLIQVVEVSEDEAKKPAASKRREPQPQE